MHSSPRLGSKLLELAHQPPAVGAPLDHEPSIKTSRAVVRESEEVESLAAPGVALFAQLACKLSELDEAFLLLVERQLELCQTLLEVCQHPPHVGLVLKAHHEIVAVA